MMKESFIQEQTRGLGIGQCAGMTDEQASWYAKHITFTRAQNLDLSPERINVLYGKMALVYEILFGRNITY